MVKLIGNSGVGGAPWWKVIFFGLLVASSMIAALAVGEPAPVGAQSTPECVVVYEPELRVQPVGELVPGQPISVSGRGNLIVEGVDRPRVVPGEILDGCGDFGIDDAPTLDVLWVDQTTGDEILLGSVSDDRGYERFFSVPDVEPGLADIVVGDLSIRVAVGEPLFAISGQPPLDPNCGILTNGFTVRPECPHEPEPEPEPEPCPVDPDTPNDGCVEPAPFPDLCDFQTTDGEPIEWPCDLPVPCDLIDVEDCLGPPPLCTFGSDGGELIEWPCDVPVPCGLAEAEGCTELVPPPIPVPCVLVEVDTPEGPFTECVSCAVADPDRCDEITLITPTPTPPPFLPEPAPAPDPDDRCRSFAGPAGEITICPGPDPLTLPPMVSEVDTSEPGAGDQGDDAVEADETTLEDVPDCFGLVPTLFGTDGDDVIHGTAGRDVIAGLGGDDVLFGHGGDDVICGGPGHDTIRGQTGQDALFGGEGDDKVRGGNGNDLLHGGAGADHLAGGRGDDVVHGDAGDDTVRGSTGNDLVDGGEGHDVVSGNGGSDVVLGGPGNDKVTGGPRPDTVQGGPGDDSVKGNKGADQVVGGEGIDLLFGGPQPDQMDGGAGQDTCSRGAEYHRTETLVGCEITSGATPEDS